jgi:hypothetical protein
MADNNQAEQNRLLKEENKILREQIDLKSESISLSGALLDDIKELFGIQSKRTTQEQSLLNLNKEINRQINNQKISASSVNEVQKQIAKNSNLIEKSIAQQDSLNKKLLGADKLRVETIEDSLKNLDKNEKKLQEILNLSKEERDLQQDMIKGLKEDIKLDNDIIDNNLENLSLNGRILLTTKLQTKELEKQNTEREKDAKLLEKIEDRLGVAGKLSKLISTIPGLGNASAKALETVTDQIKQAADEGKELPNKMQTLKMLVKETGKNLITDLKDPFVIITFLANELINAFKLVDGLTGDLAKGMNMSYHDASAMSSELNSAANASGDIFVTTKGMQESLLAINKTLGTNVMLNKEDLATMTKFRTTAGLTNEELAGIYKLTLGTNKSLEDATGEVLAQSIITSKRLGVHLNEKEVLKEIKDVSAATTLSLGKNPPLIAEAVATAKSLGLEMSKIDAIAESLLNFQSSIESELEAELLTGRQLNLEQARYYALTNDVAGLAEEISKNLGSSAEFGKMNRLQQEAIAKSVGMNREELAKTLFIQDQLKDVSKDEVEKREELLNSLTEQYGVEGAQKKLKEKSIEDLEKQASIQDRMNASVEKLREIFVAVAEALMPVFDIFVDVFKIVGPIVGFIGEMVKLTIQLGKYLLPVYGVYQGIKIIQQSLVTKAVAQYSISKLQKAEDMGINAVKLYRNKIEDQGIAKKIAYNAQVLVGLIREQGVVGLKTFALTLDDKSIAKKIIMKTYDVASFVIEKSKAVWTGIQIGYQTTLNAIKGIGNLADKGNLVVNIGKAAMGAISSLSSIPVIGWALGLAAAGTSIALGYKFLKGNDIVSPGYGKRTLMSPEGAITLNDKDTIIAGTDLGGKGKSKTQESTSIASSSINIQPLIDEMAAVRAILTSILNKEGNVSIDGNLVGKTLALAEYRTGS